MRPHAVYYMTLSENQGFPFFFFVSRTPWTKNIYEMYPLRLFLKIQQHICMFIRVCMYVCMYRMSQEECLMHLSPISVAFLSCRLLMMTAVQ